jgi:hypothetical protein
MIAKERFTWFTDKEMKRLIEFQNPASRRRQDKHNKATLATCAELGSLYHSLSFMHTPKISRRRRVCALCNNLLKISN